MAPGTDYRIRVYASEVSGEGFRVHIDTWLDTVLHLAGVSWIAMPLNKSGVAIGYYSTTDIRHWEDPRSDNSSATTFGGYMFSRAPRVYAGLTGFDVKGRANLRLRTRCDDVKDYGLTWHVDTWLDTIMHSAAGAYIAIE